MNTTVATRLNEDAPLETGPITVLRTQLEQRAEEFRMVLPSHISPQKFQRTVLTAVQTNPELLNCDRRSLLTACMKSAYDGCLPDGWEAAIVPFNTRMKVGGQWQWVKLAQYMPMVAGLRKKILQSDEVTDIYAAVVYRQELEGENPRFIHREGSEHKLFHAPIYDLNFRPKDEDIALAYSVATFANGYQSFEVMRRFEIDEVREASQTGAQFDDKGNPRDAKGPWVEWFAEMCKKSVIRRHVKSLPQSTDVIADVEAEDMAFASRSALALLDRTQPEPPAPRLEDGTFADETDEPEPKPEPKKKSEQPKKESQQPPAKPEPEAPSHVDASDNDPPEAEPEPEPEPDQEPDDLHDTDEYDELGITKTDDERKADEFVTRAKACENIIDFRKLEREAEMDLAEMPVHLAAIVDTAFEHARKRLTPRRK